MSNFFDKSDITRKDVDEIVSETLKDCDDGEIYFENSKSESILLDDNKIKSSNYSSDLGFGFRAISNEVVAYSHSNEISKDALKNSAENLKSTLKSIKGTYNHEIPKTNNKFYDDINPIKQKTLDAKLEVLNNVNDYLKNDNWKNVCEEALRIASVNLDSKPAPAGEMKVVLGPGWPAILIHEAIGHGLEGDFNRKKTSAFHDLMGQKVASEGVTIVDDGTIDKRRGSLTIDDEGTPTERTVLIENGILKNFMQDRLNARLMNTRSTGSGRRESYKHIVLPRMRNTMMLSGNQTQDEMIKSVDKGIFAVSFGGGQVDITSGKFVFNCTEAYEINNGKIGSPIKGATLIGDGPSILKEVSMVGNDMMMDPGIGTCGKAGQGVPVGVAQPSILIDKMTVGGTKL